MDILSCQNFDYFKFIKTKEKLLCDFPFLKAKRIGKSVMGKEICAFMLGEAEEYVLFVGGVSGSEGYTSLLLSAFLYDLSKALSLGESFEGLRVRRALKGRALAVVPCLNPDGCEIAAKGKAGCGNFEKTISVFAKNGFESFSTNARGVDLDRNFTALSGLTEPETVALNSFINELPLRHAVVFGSGNGEIVSANGDYIPNRSLRMGEIMATSTGYTFEKQPLIYEGFIDRVGRVHKKPAFKILCEKPKSEELLNLYKELREVLILSAIM